MRHLTWKPADQSVGPAAARLPEVSGSLGRAAGGVAPGSGRRAGWQGRVVYAVDDGRATVMVEAWVHARHLQPAGD
jgi:hypothetical protein